MLPKGGDRIQVRQERIHKPREYLERREGGDRGEGGMRSGSIMGEEREGRNAD